MDTNRSYGVWQLQPFRETGEGMFTTYDNLRDNILCDMDTTFKRLKKERLIAVERNALKFGRKMACVQCKDRSDGVKWECRRKVEGK